MDIAHQAEAPRRAYFGFRTSMTALEDASADSHIYATQAVFWAALLDEMLWKLPAYTKARDADPGGVITRGARFIRNGVIHGAITTTARRGGIEFPITFPMTYDYAVWSPLEEVLKIWPPRATPHLAEEQASYGANFDERRVLEPLVEVDSWFQRSALGGYVLGTVPRM